MKPTIIFFYLIGIGFNAWLMIWNAYDGNINAFFGYLNAVVWAGFAIFMTRIARKRAQMIDDYSKMVDSYAAMVKDLQSYIRQDTERMKAQSNKIMDEVRKAEARKNDDSFEVIHITDYPDVVIPPKDLDAKKRFNLKGPEPTEPTDKG